MRGLLIVLLSFGLLLAQASLAFAQDSLEVEPGVVSPGGDVLVSGGGCAPGTKAQLVLSSPGASSTGSVLVRPGGQFSAKVEVPNRIRPGRADLVASCRDLDGDRKTLSSTIVVERPDLEITGVNLLFGLGGFLITCGLGVAMRRRPQGPRSR